MPGFLEQFFPEVLDNVDDRGSGANLLVSCRRHFFTLHQQSILLPQALILLNSK